MNEKNSPKVSVILTSFNHEKFLRSAINSALQQTYSDFELIIWDDASTDSSWEIITSYKDPRIRAFRNEKNEKRGSLNRMIEISQGEFIAVHHSDDVWTPKKLEKQVRFLEENQSIGAVFTQALIIDEDGNPFSDLSNPYQYIFTQKNRSRFEWLNHFFFHGNALCHPSALIRKECYLKVGGYNNGFFQFDDLDMWIRLCLVFDIHVLEEKLTCFRILENNQNASSPRPDSKIRSHFEKLRVLENFRLINSLSMLKQIFPDIKPFINNEDDDIEFVLGYYIIKHSKDEVMDLFALNLLFNAVNDPKRALLINDYHNFSKNDFYEISGRIEVFSNYRNESLHLNDPLTKKGNPFQKYLSKILDRFQKSSYTKLIKNSKYFDEDWYLEQNKDVANEGIDAALHFLLYGGAEGRDPGPNFSIYQYYRKFPDAKLSGLNPLIHFLIKNETETKKGKSLEKATAQGNMFCPVCNHVVDQFLPIIESFKTNHQRYGFQYSFSDLETMNHDNYSCPFCGASDRDRLMAQFLNEKIKTEQVLTLLDIAPAKALANFIFQYSNIMYLSIDKFSHDVDLNLDLTNLKQIDENYFNIFICSHVLEHVDDDKKALKELYRVLKPGGFGLLLVPIYLSCTRIDEDPKITDIAERWRRFGQDDHVRLYSKAEFVDRIRNAGFELEECGVNYFSEDTFRMIGISSSSVLYVVRK